MKVDNQFIVIDGAGLFQVLYKCKNDAWYITTNGAFGQRDMRLIAIDRNEAELLIKNTQL